VVSSRRSRSEGPNCIDELGAKGQVLRKMSGLKFHFMKQLFSKFIFAAAWLVAVTMSAQDAERLNGKWSVQKTNDQGTFTQTVEVKGSKFIFEIQRDGGAVLHAEGDMKLEKLGPFNSVRFTNVRGGQSATDLQEVNDEFISVYTLDGDTWLMASNFDKDRQGRKPSLDRYQRAKAAAGPQSGTLVIDEIEMADTPQSATWFLCFEAKVEGVSKRHYVANKGYEKNKMTIPMALELPNVKAGQKCSFKMQLDDVDEDTCTDEVDNRSTGEFAVTERGSQSFKPEANWQYTLKWHLK
jgi:hypothetical protein